MNDKGVLLFDALSYIDEELTDNGVEKPNKNKKRLAVILIASAAAVILITASVLIGLHHNDGRLSGEYPDDIVRTASEYDKIKLTADWPYYSTAKELADAATHIYSGTVTDISFAVIDYKTGKEDGSPQSKSTNRMLYTVYTVGDIVSRKGETAGTVKICKPGGIAGYKEKEQYDLLTSSGLNYEGIPVYDDNCSLCIGENYLFCVKRGYGDYDNVVNLTQFACRLGSDNAAAILRSASAGSSGAQATSPVLTPVELNSYSALQFTVSPINEAKLLYIDFSKANEEQSGNLRYFLKTVRSKNNAVPYFNGEKMKLSEEKGYSSITLFASDLYGLPGIYYHPESYRSVSYIQVTYLPERIMEKSGTATASEIIAELAPNYPNVDNLGERYSNIYNKDITLADRTVTALVYEKKDDTRITVRFFYDGLSVTVTGEPGYLNGEWFSALSFGGF